VRFCIFLVTPFSGLFSSSTDVVLSPLLPLPVSVVEKHPSLSVGCESTVLSAPTLFKLLGVFTNDELEETGEAEREEYEDERGERIGVVSLIDITN